MERLLDHWAATDANWHGRAPRLQWHATLCGDPGLNELVERLRPILACGYLAPVEQRWLHLTLHDVGPARGHSRQDLERLTRAAQDLCSGLPPLRLHLGPPRLMQTAVVLEALPAAPVSRLRRALRGADVRLRGPAATPLPTGPASRPHVSLAYARRAATPNGLEQELQAAVGEDPVDVVVDRIELLLLERDYTWNPVARVELGGAEALIAPAPRGPR